MRGVRQQELGEVRKEVMRLLDDNEQLLNRLRDAQDREKDVRQQMSSWKQLWHTAMDSNLLLTDRLAVLEVRITAIAGELVHST